MSAAPATGRRERKKEATRRALEDSAWALFGTQGFAATTIEEIAERVDVAPRTFFRYFPSKEAVLVGDPRALEEPFRRALEARPVGEAPYAAIRGALVEVASQVERQRERHLLRHRLLEQHGPAVDGFFLTITEKGQMLRDVIAEELAGRVDAVGAELLGGAAMTVMDVAYRQWMAGGATEPLAEVAAKAFDELKRLAAR